MENEQQIRLLVENWASAARAQNYDGVMAFHHPDIVMYDVPPPFQSKGLDAYKKTWQTFFDCPQNNTGIFDILELNITAGNDVAFCFAHMQCASVDNQKPDDYLQFRLTIGFKKIDGQWWFMHEHHSVPGV